MEAVLRVGPTADQLAARANRVWAGSEWPLGQARRFALSYDAWNDAQAAPPSAG